MDPGGHLAGHVGLRRAAAKWRQAKFQLADDAHSDRWHSYEDSRPYAPNTALTGQGPFKLVQKSVSTVTRHMQHAFMQRSTRTGYISPSQTSGQESEEARPSNCCALQR
eukprot:4626356-Amphidinium_carterae.1